MSQNIVKLGSMSLTVRLYGRLMRAAGTDKIEIKEHVRYLTSICLGIPIHKIAVHAPCLGGGFGGKAGLNMEPLAILLSKKAGSDQ